MKLKAIAATAVLPVKKFFADDLSNVVVIAGPNGVGKSRFLKWILTFFQNLPTDANNWIQVEATSPQELRDWGKPILDTRQPADAGKLRATMQKQRRRNAYQSSLLNFESDRKISQVKPYAFTWDSSDPYLEELGWNFGFRELTSRFQDTVHTIFRKVRSRSEAISRSVLAQAKKNAGEVAIAEHIVPVDLRNFPDPTVVFKNAFSQLLAPKQLIDPDPKEQRKNIRRFRERRFVAPQSYADQNGA